MESFLLLQQVGFTKYFGHLNSIAIGSITIFIIISLISIKPIDKETKISKLNNRTILSHPIIGISLGMHSKDYSFDYKNMIEEIALFRPQWICLNFGLYQNDIYSQGLNPIVHDKFEQLDKTIKLCKELGLKVMVNPILYFVDETKSSWRGEIKAPNVEDWFDSYQANLSPLIAICNSNKVEAMGIGSELCSIQNEKGLWLNLIKQIRNSYTGLLTYSANWDFMEDIPFYKELDFIGVSGYFSISKSNTPSEQELYDNWLKIKIYLMYLQELKFQKPIVITELGYASQKGTSKEPWNYLKSKMVDMNEQKMCYEAFSKTWKNEPGFNGVFFYDWFGVGGKDDLGYTFKNKPASEVVCSWF